MRHWTALLCMSLLCSFSTPSLAIVSDLIETISVRACETNSDCLLILNEGRVIANYGKGQQLCTIDTRSVTKTFVAIAIGLLMQEGKIQSVDTGVFAFFPEWRQGFKQEVTLRHLLSHTSGLKDSEGMEIYEFPDSVKVALVSDFASEPGSRFAYNNKAVNLLAAIVERAAGMSVHQYLKQRLFVPLGITSDIWLCDHAGNNYGMSHLSLNCLDLAKIGLLLSAKGSWYGRQLLPKEWVDFMTTPSQVFNPFYGSLCWIGYDSLSIYWDPDIIQYYALAGIPPEFLRCLENMQGQVFTFQGYVSYGNFTDLCSVQLASYFNGPDEVRAFLALLQDKGLPIGRWEEGKVKSIAARGHLGQQLLVFPDDNLIAVRLSNTCCQCSDGSQDAFAELESWIAMLTYEMFLFRNTSTNDCL